MNKILEKLKNITTTYQPIDGFPHTTTDLRKKGFKTILNTIVEYTGNPKGLKFLDVGCCFGYFCFQLEKMGAYVDGVDISLGRINTCQALKKYYKLSDKTINFYNSDMNERIESLKKVDYIIMLNMFHHMLVKDEKKSWETFNKLLNKSKAIFVMMRNSYGKWEMCRHHNEIGDAVVKNSDATWYKVLGRVHGRIIYVFGVEPKSQ